MHTLAARSARSFAPTRRYREQALSRLGWSSHAVIMTNTLSRFSIVGFVIAIVLWQISSCCCCLGGATSPPVTPVAPSVELAQAMRDRIMQVKSTPGPFTLEVTDQELTSYIIGLLQSGAGEFPARDMQIAFSDGYVDIWATFIDVAPTDIPAYIRATVTAQDGHLVFQIREANAGPFPVPGAMRESIAQSLSETLAELELGLWIDDVRVEPERMVLTGQVTGEIPDLP
jgi:hypothetical protein